VTASQIIFILISLLTLGTGVIVVTNRNLFHAALAMMLSFLGVAMMYVTLDAGFLAAAQLLVYIGAISILIIFAIMLTRRMMQARETPFNAQWGMGLFTAVATAALTIAVVWNYWGESPAEAVRQEVPPEYLDNAVVALGRAFVNPGTPFDGAMQEPAFVVPFIAASMMLLAALIGSIYVAWPTEEEDES
jgi:NADH-quinone oxidoreductase subunit J